MAQFEANKKTLSTAGETTVNDSEFDTLNDADLAINYRIPAPGLPPDEITAKTNPVNIKNERYVTEKDYEKIGLTAAPTSSDDFSERAIVAFKAAHFKQTGEILPGYTPGLEKLYHDSDTAEITETIEVGPDTLQPTFSPSILSEPDFDRFDIQKPKKITGYDPAFSEAAIIERKRRLQAEGVPGVVMPSYPVKSVETPLTPHDFTPQEIQKARDKRAGKRDPNDNRLLAQAIRFFRGNSADNAVTGYKHIDTRGTPIEPPKPPTYTATVHIPKPPQPIRQNITTNVINPEAPRISRNQFPMPPEGVTRTETNTEVVETHYVRPTGNRPGYTTVTRKPKTPNDGFVRRGNLINPNATLLTPEDFPRYGPPSELPILEDLRLVEQKPNILKRIIPKFISRFWRR